MYTDFVSSDAFAATNMKGFRNSSESEGNIGLVTRTDQGGSSVVVPFCLLWWQTFHLTFVHSNLVWLRLLLGKSCSLHSFNHMFSLYFDNFVILVFSCFGFDGRIWAPIAPGPGHYMLVNFISIHSNR